MIMLRHSLSWRRLLKAAGTSSKSFEVKQSSTSTPTENSCRLLVVGGGAAGCSLSSKFVSKLGDKKVIVLEPADIHYYQPLLTLVGAGICRLEDCARPMRSVLPKNVTWIKDEAIAFAPEENKVHTKNGSVIKYDILVLALGLQLNFDKVTGLLEAINMPNSGVCSNYSPKYASKTFKELQTFSSGNAIFTCPSTPIKCGGAPQKIAYLAHDYFNKVGKRQKANMMFKTGGAVYFPSPYYEAALYPVAESRGIDVALKQDLIAIDHKNKIAIFKDIDSQNEDSIQYSFLHVTPPQGPPPVLGKSKELIDAAGWVNVDKESLQHVKFNNIFGIGDCTNLPTSKTAAAVAGQLGVLRQNISSFLMGKPLDAKYNGYTSCPLTTGYGKLIMAEFDYDKKPLETFPFDQRKESWLMYQAKRFMLPSMYWNLMLKGLWEGPSRIRQFIK